MNLTSFKNNHKGLISNIIVYSVIKKAVDNLAVTRNTNETTKTNTIVNTMNKNLGKKHF